MESSIFGIVGVVVGVALGHYLTRSWQREQWLLDCRKQEFKDLLCVLTKAFAIVKRLGVGIKNSTPENQQLMIETEEEAQAAIRNCIYIRETLESLNVPDRWTGIVAIAKRASLSNDCERRFHELNIDIVVAAVNLSEAPKKIH
jgi:hypothetical protein